MCYYIFSSMPLTYGILELFVVQAVYLLLNLLIYLDCHRFVSLTKAFFILVLGILGSVNTALTSSFIDIFG